MSLIIVGFGGTGAKIVQSFVMMAGAGALKISRQVKVLLVDQDRGNGNTTRADETLKTYCDLRHLMHQGGKGVRPFSVDLQPCFDGIWQPLRDDQATLRRTFDYDDSKLERDLNSRLLEMLYSPEQLKTTLAIGFRGNPNIGAPVFARTLDFSQAPWKEIDETLARGIQDGGGSTIVLCGSVFGGTGAAGIPSTCKILRERLRTHHQDGVDGKPNRVRIVLNLLMPYFSITEDGREGLQAKGKHFVANAKAALEYYASARYLDFCDALYLAGEEDRQPIEVGAAGGPEQKNAAHPLELFAACSIVDAFDAPELNNKLMLVQRAQRDRYIWDDLPLHDNASSYPPGQFRARMAAFARTAYAIRLFEPTAVNFVQKNSSGLHSWLAEYFSRGNELNLDQWNKALNFASLFLAWAGGMSLSATAMRTREREYRADWFNPATTVVGEAGKMTVEAKPPDYRDERPMAHLLAQDEPYEYTARTLLASLNRVKRPPRSGLAGLLGDIYNFAGSAIPAFGTAEEVNRA